MEQEQDKIRKFIDENLPFNPQKDIVDKSDREIVDSILQKVNTRKKSGFLRLSLIEFHEKLSDIFTFNNIRLLKPTVALVLILLIFTIFYFTLNKESDEDRIAKVSQTEQSIQEEMKVGNDSDQNIKLPKEKTIASFDRTVVIENLTPISLNNLSRGNEVLKHSFEKRKQVAYDVILEILKSRKIAFTESNNINITTNWYGKDKEYESRLTFTFDSLSEQINVTLSKRKKANENRKALNQVYNEIEAGIIEKLHLLK
jgi:hypothetical protein